MMMNVTSLISLVIMMMISMMIMINLRSNNPDWVQPMFGENVGDDDDEYDESGDYDDDDDYDGYYDQSH